MRRRVESTYVLLSLQYSPRALKYHGSSRVWVPIWSSKIKRLPKDERGFHRFFLQVIRSKGFSEGYFRLLRSGSKGEKHGFRPVAYFWIDSNEVIVERTYSQYKGMAGVKTYEDLWFKPHARQDVSNRRFQYIPSGMP